MKLFRIFFSIILILLGGVVSGSVAAQVVAKGAQHKDFIRLLFPFKVQPEVALETEGAGIVLRIRVPEKIDLSQINQRLNTPLSVKLRGEGETKYVIIANPGGGHVKHYLEKSLLVVDIYNKPLPDPVVGPAVVPEKPPLQEQKPVPEAEGSKPDTDIETLKDVIEFLEQNKLPYQRGGKDNNVPTSGKQAAPQGRKVVLKLIQNEGRDQLVFSTTRVYPAAIVQRGGATWLFLDTTEAPMDLIVAPTERDSLVVTVEKMENLIGIRINALRALHLLRVTDEVIYQLTEEEPFLPKFQRPVQIQMRDKNSLITIPLKGTRAFTWHDKEIGDAFTVIPTQQFGEGVDDYYKYIDAEIFSTMQGAVIRALSPDVTVAATDNGVVVERGEGLRLSHAKPVPFEGRSQNVSIFSFKDAEQDAKKTIQELAELRREKLPDLKGDQRAEFYFHQGKVMLLKHLFREANGFFVSALKCNPSPQQEWVYKAYTVLASMLSRDFVAARHLLSEPQLLHDPEMQLLSAIVEAKHWNLEKAKNVFQQAVLYLRQYPDPVRARLGLTAFRTAIHLKDFATASQLNELLQQTAFDTQGLQDRMMLYQAQLFLAQKNERQAALLFAKLQSSDSPRVRTKAMLYNLTKQWEKKLISDEDMLKQLEGLRQQWRHGVEYREVVDMMVQLSLKHRKYSRALSLLRQAHNKSTITADQEHYAQKIADTLVAVFEAPEAEQMPILTALALFVEFKSYLSTRDDLPKVLYPLLDRLEQYDLLAPAIDILWERVQKYAYEDVSEGPRDRLRLAKLYVRSEQGDKALEILRTIDETGFNEKQKSALRNLRVQSLILLERFNEALQLIQDDTLPSLMLKAMIHWQRADWQNVAQVLENVLQLNMKKGDEEKEGNELDISEVILMLAIAYNLNDDIAGLEKLRQTYREQMDASRMAAEFHVLADKESIGDTATVHDIRKSLSQLSAFKKFMQEKTVFVP